ncbi:MAG: hypothetical protein H7245_01680, partial [Candidatus Saccharibacteria bacterium]|nr:hypothetical protein [Pseudorhodobacter sp.]
MFYLVDHLGKLPRFGDAQARRVQRNLGPRLEPALEHDFARMGGDIDKPTATGCQTRLFAQLADIHIAWGIQLCERPKGHVEPAALKIGELRRAGHEG